MGRKNWLILLGTALFLCVFPLAVAKIKAVSHYIDVMVFAGIFCLVSIGLSLLMGYAGQISLAQAAFFGIGAYTSGILTTKFGVNPWAAIPAGMFLCGVVAWLVGIPSLRLRGHYLAMATLGFGVIVNIVLSEEINWTGGPSGMTDIPALRIAGYKIDSEMAWYYLVWGLVFCALIFCFHILHSRVGRALRAIHEEEKAAESMGVPTANYKVRVFVLGAMLAAVAGSLYTHYVGCINPSSFNLMWSMRFMLMVMVGGMYSLWGAVVGTILMTFIGNEWLQVFAEFEILIYGSILLFVALFLPEGIISLFNVRAPWHRKRDAALEGTGS
jgi:branched-chain amino acid transport system permease protein